MIQLHEVSLRTALAHDVGKLVARWILSGDVYNCGAFELARKQHDAAIALILEQCVRANGARQIFKIVLAKGCRQLIKPRSSPAIHAGVLNLTVDGHVPYLVGSLHRNHAPGDGVKKRESHACFSAAVCIHQRKAERRDVARVVLLRRQQLDDSQEALPDTACGGSSALHGRIVATERNSGADLKVAVDALGKPAEQAPGV